MRQARWTVEDDTELRRLVAIGAKIPAIARDLSRTQGSIRVRMVTLGIHRQEGRWEISKTARDHLESTERRLVKATARAARANAENY